VRARPAVSGGMLAFAAAATFGATTPLVQRFGRGVGPFTTATLLYLGATLVASLARGPRVDPLRRSDAPRLFFVAMLGAVAAPMALAWGLQRTSGVTASLLLNLEAPFTVLLARAVWREPVGLRVGGAVLVMGAAGALLVIDGREASVAAGWGALAVAGATLAWASDAVAGRPLADRDAASVVLAKSAIGATASFVLGRVLGESWPGSGTVLALAGCGAVGYGVSLGLYLRAQRAIGAARTGTVFAAAPFIGAAVALALGERAAGSFTLVAGALCAIGVWLNLGERHGHAHVHAAVDHEHPHRHDDGHHLHPHDVYPPGEHTHPHSHETLEHTHPHGQDVDHRHEH
jgi:drug/metabolite transporter (DMT)-like permease